jgi:peptidoglycan/LPS O-acetylase OafA/YrhL
MTTALDMPTQPAAAAAAATRNYAALDGIRGYAAVLVSVTHFTGFYAAGFRGWEVERATYATVPSITDAAYLWLYLSMHSLYILLTISGYMVCRMVMRPSYGGYRRFLAARALRIYPPLLFSLFFALVVFTVMKVPLDLSAANVLYNVLTLNGIFELKGQPYNFPTWSLFYEIVYCLLVPVLVGLSRGRRHAIPTLFLLWAAFLGLLAVSGFSGWILFAPFVTGSILAQWDDRKLSEIGARVPTWVVIAVYAVVSALPSTWAPLPRLDADGFHFAPSYIVFIGLACAMSCLLLAKAVFASGPLQQLFALRPVEYLGKVSYSYYVLHAPLITVAFQKVSPVIGQWSTPGSFAHYAQLLVVFFVLVVASATFGYYAVEMIYFRSRFSSRSKKFISPPSGSPRPAG